MSNRRRRVTNECIDSTGEFDCIDRGDLDGEFSFSSGGFTLRSIRVEKRNVMNLYSLADYSEIMGYADRMTIYNYRETITSDSGWSNKYIKHTLSVRENNGRTTWYVSKSLLNFLLSRRAKNKVPDGVADSFRKIYGKHENTFGNSACRDLEDTRVDDVSVSNPIGSESVIVDCSTPPSDHLQAFINCFSNDNTVTLSDRTIGMLIAYCSLRQEADRNATADRLISEKILELLSASLEGASN